MAFKTLRSKIYKSQKGVTLIELLVVMAIMMALSGSVYLILRPAEYYARARDERRLSDIMVIDRIINEFFQDNGVYPDIADTLRVSTSLPADSAGPFNSATQGWIIGNFSTYNSIMPIDPVNDDIFFYSYQQDGYAYEINVRLEAFLDHAETDGGNNDELFEIGTDLTILP